jgi:hypothetical protein
MPEDVKWSDALGTFRAGILASKVYEVLGKKGYGTDITDWVHEPLPSLGNLTGGELVFRQHDSGPTSDQNLRPLFNWIAILSSRRRRLNKTYKKCQFTQGALVRSPVPEVHPGAAAATSWAAPTSRRWSTATSA